MVTRMISLQELKSTKWKLAGSRAYLRALDVDDATNDYSRWLSDPSVNRFLATKSATVPELKQYITTKNQEDDTVLLGIFLKESDAMFGTVKLEDIDYAKCTADIAIMLGDRNHSGKGLGGEAMRILIDYAFSDLCLSEITLGVVVQNVGAVRAYEKLGFTETGRKLGVVEYGGKVYDQMTMRLQKAH
ncbi:MAG: GNAT family N-acetyltransferase [bacterium]|nr:GNAT family N-acetyltransferase [bacterium]